MILPTTNDRSAGTYAARIRINAGEDARRTDSDWTRRGAARVSVGSYATVLAARIPEGQSVSRPASRCPQCGSALTAAETMTIVTATDFTVVKFATRPTRNIPLMEPHRGDTRTWLARFRQRAAPHQQTG